ncbi:MAG TPA: phosphotransferase [Nocardioidaceae bacterium]|nr:phosphotransferase [Nocardioidaceae bacterium]
MTTPLEETIRRADAAGLALRKAIPKGPDQLLLELTDACGRLVAGQWRREPAQAADIADRLRAMYGPDSATLLGAGVVIAHDGADRRLSSLHQQARRPGSRLLAHRAERRGVVRHADGSFVKVVRPSQVSQLVASLIPADVAGLVFPTVTGVEAGAGCVRTAALPGRGLHELLQDTELSDHEVDAALQQVGAAVAELHHTPAGRVLSTHGAQDELAVARGWLEAATEFGLLSPSCWTDGLRVARRLLSGQPSTSVRLHRDLHDKQLLIASGAPVGLLDLDLSAAGEPALDLANLLTHLELRHLQGLVDQTRWQSAQAALLDGYRPGPSTLSRLPGYRQVARLRLAAVYAFRTAEPDLVRALLVPTPDKELIP